MTSLYDFSKFSARKLLEMSLKDSTCPVRESVSVDSLATGTVLRETTTDQAQQADGTPPETR